MTATADYSDGKVPKNETAFPPNYYYYYYYWALQTCTRTYRIRYDTTQYIICTEKL